MLMDALDLAYAAGFFDGEGHIAIAYNSRAKKHSGGRDYFNERYWLYVQISQIDPRPLQWLQKRFGGALREVRAKRSYDGGMYRRWD